MKASVGTDLVAIARLERAISELGQAFLDRTFTPAEQADCAGSAERLAARWAAKESVLKALGAGIDRISLLDVEIGRSRSGMPTITLSGSARSLAAEQGWAAWSVSLSHDGQYATAVVIATA